MNLGEAIDEVRFYIDEDDNDLVIDVNKVYTDARIAKTIYDGQKEYAKLTRGIEGVESLATAKGKCDYDLIYPLQIQGIKKAYLKQSNIFIALKYQPRFEVRNSKNNFPQKISFWQKKITLDSLCFDAPTSSLTQDISAEDNLIEVNNSIEFAESGTIEINNEKISYYKKEGNVLYISQRGTQATKVSAHSQGDKVTNHNIYLEIYKLPYPIPVEEDGSVSDLVKRQQLEIPEDDQNIAIEYAIWKLLSKDTDSRYIQHKDNYLTLISEARTRIIKQRQIMQPFEMVDVNRFASDMPSFVYGG